MNTNRRFQEIVTTGFSKEKIISIYREYVRDELRELQEAKTLPEIIKEACDVAIVCDPLIWWGDSIDAHLHTNIKTAMMNMIDESTVDYDSAMNAVVCSNMSKFLLPSELVNAQAHFIDMGIHVRFDQLDHELFGAFSQKDQTVDGKFYPKDKLLKPHSYAEVDESREFWL